MNRTSDSMKTKTAKPRPPCLPSGFVIEIGGKPTAPCVDFSPPVLMVTEMKPKVFPRRRTAVLAEKRLISTVKQVRGSMVDDMPIVRRLLEESKSPLNIISLREREKARRAQAKFEAAEAKANAKARANP